MRVQDQGTTDHEAAGLHRLLCPYVTRLIRYLDGLIPPSLRRLIDPQDVAHDAFFQAARSAGPASLDEPDLVWRWLATIGRHRLTDIIREQQAAKRGGGRLRYLDDTTPRHSSVIEVLQELAVHRRTPSRSAVRREFIAVLEQSMGRIDPAYRNAVRLRYIEGLSLQQAAERMSRTEESMKKLCLRGLRALRTELRSISRFA